MESPAEHRGSRPKGPDKKPKSLKNKEFKKRIFQSVAAGIFAFGFLTACTPQAAAPTLSPDILNSARQTMTAQAPRPQETIVPAPVLPTGAVAPIAQVTEIIPPVPSQASATPLVSLEWPWPNSGSPEDWLANNLKRVQREIKTSGYREASQAISGDLLQAEASFVTRSKEGKLYGGTVTQIGYDSNTGTAFFITVGHVGEDFFTKSLGNKLKTIELRQPHLGRKFNINLSDAAVYVDLSTDIAMFAVRMPQQITSTTTQFAFDSCNNPVSYSGSLAAFGFPYISKEYAPYFSQGEKDKGCFLYQNKPYLSTTTATYEGMSGAPIVNSSGQIVGFVDVASPNGSGALTLPSQQLISDMQLLAQAALK